MNFYKERIALLGVTDKNNKMDVIDTTADAGMRLRKDHPIFSEDSAGNIVITFCTLKNELIHYERSGEGKMSHINAKWIKWQQVRLREPKGDMKYKLPKGGGIYPFIPPLIREAYQKKKKVDTVFLTEGAFKSWKASLNKIHCFGLTSITHYRDSVTKKLHPDIIEFIKVCEVKNVVVLWDGDCLNISSKALYAREDISKRPFGFYNAAKKIGELLGEANEDREEDQKLNFFFYHVISDSFSDHPKGLDDIIVSAEKEGKTKVASLIKSIHKCDESKDFFFKKLNITSGTGSLKRYFNLDDVKRFYYRHSHIIENHEFVFQRNLVKWDKNADNGAGDIIEIAPEWANKVKWIGDDFFELEEVPTAYGDTQLTLLKRNKSTLVDRYGKHFFKKLPYYKGFCNVPDHFNYQQTYNDFYNRYFPFIHQRKKGECDETIKFIQHIFGTQKITYKKEKYSSWELGLDYVKLLLENPTQMLPVLILYSAENATGKSTFGKWLRLIFNHNTVQIGNNDFDSDFNDHYADKLLIICEEALLQRKAQAEKIKSMSTSNRMLVNPKGSKHFEIDFFGKFIFMTNNPKMIYMNQYDERYWVLQVPKPREDNPTLLQKLEKELPAFLYHIKQRELSTTYQSRMWFHHSMIRTEAFRATVQANEPGHARELRKSLQEYFLDHGDDVLMMPLKVVNEAFFKGRLEKTWLTELVKDYMGAKPLIDPETGKSKQTRGYYFRTDKEMNLETQVIEEKRIKMGWNGRPYVFYRRDFVTEEEEPIKADITDHDLAASAKDHETTASGGVTKQSELF